VQNYGVKSNLPRALQSGEAKAILDSRNLTISSNNNQVVSIPFFDIQGIVDEDYSVVLFLSSGERITLTHIGYDYENFLSNLYKNRNALLLKYMLMEEANLAAGIEANYKFKDEYGDEREGICEARVYESAVVILPKKTEPIRIPISYINDFSLNDYIFTLTSGLKQKLYLSQMGKKTDYFNRSLIKAFDDMNLRTLKLLVDAFPDIDMTPGVCGGEPCIVRTRIPVWLLVQAKKLGTNEADILKCYPTLRAEDLVNAWAYYHSHKKEIEQQILENEEA